MVKSTIAAAEADLVTLKSQLDSFESNRFTKDSTVDDVFKKFPQVGKKIEQEIKNHDWLV